MIRAFAFLAVVLLAAPALAQTPATAAEPEASAQLSLEHRMLLRCSAAFALVSHRQDAGDAAALAYPPLQQRGREFFVRASARIIDEAGFDRARITAALEQEAQQLNEGGGVAPVMPACLTALEASGL